MTQPYWNTDRELPVAPEPRTCLLCGFEATSELIWLRPAWWREAIEGRWITTIPRCLDIDACRARVAALGEPWPLLEAGEEPGRQRLSKPPADYSNPIPTQPIDPPLPTPPDAEPEEARHDVDYF